MENDCQSTHFGSSQEWSVESFRMPLFVYFRCSSAYGCLKICKRDRRRISILHVPDTPKGHKPYLALPEIVSRPTHGTFGVGFHRDTEATKTLENCSRLI